MIEPQEILKSLQWRYACKKFDSSKRISEDQLELLLNAFNLTATSLGMQLMKCVVVSNQDLKEEMVSFCHGQRQVADCSEVLVLCRFNTVEEKHVDEYVHRSATIREMDMNSSKVQGFRNMVLSTTNYSDERKLHWMTNQVYISLGNLLNTCAMLGIDSCPMEGFLPSAVDKMLNLTNFGLNSVLLLPVGYRHEEDAYSNYSKVRRDFNDSIIRIV